VRDVHLFWDGGSIYLLSLLTCNFSNTAADILLWRDEKRTFSFVTVLFVLFYWFLLSDRTFVSSAAKFLLVISLALFIHGVLPSQVYVFWLFSYLLSRLIWCGCFLLHSQEFCSVLWLSTEVELLLHCSFGFTFEKVTSDHFELSHSALRNSLMCLAYAWNGSIHKLRVLAEGEDWSTLLKVGVQLYWELSPGCFMALEYPIWCVILH